MRFAGDCAQAGEVSAGHLPPSGVGKVENIYSSIISESRSLLVLSSLNDLHYFPLAEPRSLCLINFPAVPGLCRPSATKVISGSCDPLPSYQIGASEQYTEEWAAIEIDASKVDGTNFTGNAIDLGTRIPAYELMHPNPQNPRPSSVRTSVF
jgi:hypothetical protein